MSSNLTILCFVRVIFDKVYPELQNLTTDIVEGHVQTFFLKKDTRRAVLKRLNAFLLSAYNEENVSTYDVPVFR